MKDRNKERFDSWPHVTNRKYLGLTYRWIGRFPMTLESYRQEDFEYCGDGFSPKDLLENTYFSWKGKMILLKDIPLSLFRQMYDKAVYLWMPDRKGDLHACHFCAKYKPLNRFSNLCEKSSAEIDFCCNACWKAGRTP